MKIITLKEIDDYLGIANKLRHRHNITHYDDGDSVTGLIKSKLAFILLVKVLKELEIISNTYEYAMPVFDEEMLKDDSGMDNMYELGEMLESLVVDVYTSCNWTINNYCLYSFFDSICEDMGIALDDIRERTLDVDETDNFIKNISENHLKDFLKEDFTLHQEFVLDCANALVNSFFETRGFHVLHNKKLGKYLSHVLSHPELSITEIGKRIGCIVDISINPLQMYLNYNYMQDIIYREEFTTSYLFYNIIDSAEYIDSNHFQLDRVLYVVLLDALLDMAYEEFSITEVAV